ncbi:hypothetical protein EVAR_46413_1 [Eumeta japonica]|uniref:Uncharacterized protein n=1 Tax=Eumeta variegata TaxID=151549 RepID=A0A4C1XF01_EUMVA|nr:hypothetical protein EVAR_46413_1 [Eumeta japonica]
MTLSSERSHSGMEMPSARDCPTGVLNRHLCIRGHEKLQYGLKLQERDTGRCWERTGLMTFKGRNEWGNPYSYSIAILLTSSRSHSVSSSMALCNRGRIFRRQFERKKSAVSSANGASWTPDDGRGMSFTYAEYCSGESVEP